MFAQTLFIVWRESIEALLVVGILHAWLTHNAEGRAALRYLWGGVAAGVAAAVVLSFVLMRFGASLPPEGQDYFQAGLMLVAGALIVQMVFWMRRHGSNLKRELEHGLAVTARRGSWWGVFVIALIAVAREGSETVIFLHGMLAAAGAAGFGELAGAIALALVAALVTYGALQLGGRHLSWRLFFRATEIMLLLLACALLVNAVGYLVSFGLLPYGAPLWDTSVLIDDMSRFGGLIASLTGYRAQPDPVTLITWLVYWGAIAAVFRLQARPQGRSRLAAS